MAFGGICRYAVVNGIRRLGFFGGYLRDVCVGIDGTWMIMVQCIFHRILQVLSNQPVPPPPMATAILHPIPPLLPPF